MCLTLRSDVEPKIARVSSSYVQSSGYVLLRSSFTLVPSRLLPGGVMEWGLRFFLMKSRTANSYYETSTRRHGQRCPPTLPATRAHIFWGRCHANSMAAAKMSY
jgi:hypothetical protein